MSRHEVPDDAGTPQIPPSLLRKLEQNQQPETPVYRVDQSGQGRLEKPDGIAPPHDPGGDLMPMLDGIEKMGRQLQDAVSTIPGIEADVEQGKIRAERFDLSTRLALVHAGNALDYALRRVEDIARTQRIAHLRSELSHEMRRAGLEGDPRDGMTPV